MQSFCDLETDQMQAARQTYLAANPPPPSRLSALFDRFVKYAGAIAVDHTHTLPLDRISASTEAFPSRAPQRECC